MNENVLIGSPTVFSTNQLPVSDESIPKQEDVARWPFLNGVRLLIGLDVPKALQSEEVRKSQQGGPFAVRIWLESKFCWALNGPLQRDGMKSKQCHLSNVL